MVDSPLLRLIAGKYFASHIWDSYIVLIVAGVKMCAYATRALDLSERS